MNVFTESYKKNHVGAQFAQEWTTVKIWFLDAAKWVFKGI
jgi:hypothetical protein